MRQGFFAVLAAVVAWTTPVAATAQDEAESATEPASVQVTGRVVDASSNAPIHGAWVSLKDLDWGVLTDAQGRFSLSVDRADRFLLIVENLGYEAVEQAVDAPPPPDLTLEMDPNPVQLEELRVMGDRFQSRRRATSMSVRAFERDALLMDSSIDVMQFLQSRTGRPIRECPFRSAFASLCIRARGRWQRVQVYVDEMPVFGGLDELRTYKPQELYMIEVYNFGAHIRLYSTTFMDRLVRSGRRLTPVPIG